MPRAFLKARDPFSCYSHFVGAVLSVSGLLILLLRLLFDPDISGQLAGAAVVFCLSLIALYSASSVYHFSLRGEAVLRRLKKLDHSMIYVLIAGSYTPIILKFMPAPRSFLFLGVIWLIALTGIAIGVVLGWQSQMGAMLLFNVIVPILLYVTFHPQVNLLRFSFGKIPKQNNYGGETLNE